MGLIEFLLFGTLLQQNRDECRKIKNPTPVSSWNEVELAENFVVRRLKGEIFDANGSPLSKTRIELVKLPSSGKAKLLIVCRAETNRFRFNRLEEGSYELRFSLEGFDRTIVKVVVSGNGKPEKEVRVMMKASN